MALRPDHQKAGNCYSDRKSTRLNSSHLVISYAVFCLKKKKNKSQHPSPRKFPCSLHDENLQISRIFSVDLKSTTCIRKVLQLADDCFRCIEQSSLDAI